MHLDDLQATTCWEIARDCLLVLGQQATKRAGGGLPFVDGIGMSRSVSQLDFGAVVWDRAWRRHTKLQVEVKQGTCW